MKTEFSKIAKNKEQGDGSFLIDLVQKTATTLAYSRKPINGSVSGTGAQRRKLEFEGAKSRQNVGILNSGMLPHGCDR